MDRTPIVRRAGAFVVAGLLVGGLAACGDDDDGDATSDTSETSAPAQELEITEVWARTSAPGQKAGAAYMVITGGDEDDRLRAASVDAAVACETQIHETVPVEEDGDGMGDTTTTTAGDMGEGGMGEEECDTGMGDMGGGSTTTTMAGGGDMTTTTGEDGGMGEGEGGMGEMTMREVDAIEVPAGEAVTLEPGGYHVMLLGLAKPLATGDTFDIELEFENAGTVMVTAEVRER